MLPVLPFMQVCIPPKPPRLQNFVVQSHIYIYIKCIKSLNKPTQIYWPLPLSPLQNILSSLPLMLPSLLFIQLPLNLQGLPLYPNAPHIPSNFFFLFDIQNPYASNHWKSPYPVFIITQKVPQGGCKDFKCI